MARTRVSVAPRGDGKWIVQTDNQDRAVSVHASKGDAVHRGRELAVRQGKELIVRGADGRVMRDSNASRTSTELIRQYGEKLEDSIKRLAKR